MPRHPEPLSEEEIERRSVLMRLYHSHWMGEESYPARFVNGHAPELAAKGWIEAVGEGWHITPVGIVAWAKMNEAMLKHKWAITAAQFNELRAVLNIKQKGRKGNHACQSFTSANRMASDNDTGTRKATPKRHKAVRCLAE